MAHNSRGQKELGKSNKPFCDCKTCNASKCPNILDKLGVTLKDKPSVKEKTVVPKLSKPKKVESENSDRILSLLGIVNPDRPCNCTVVAKALHSDIHKNIGTLLHRGLADIKASPSNDADQHIEAKLTSTAVRSPPKVEDNLPK